jgi:hypothetical protein
MESPHWRVETSESRENRLDCRIPKAFLALSEMRSEVVEVEFLK